MPRGEAYTYRDARTFRVRDRRQNRNFMVLFETELIYLVRFDVGRAAMLLYLYIGTRASGSVDGWDIGITELEDRLILGRSTIYKGVAQLVRAGLLRRVVSPSKRHLTVELCDVKSARWPRSEEVEHVREARRGQRMSAAVDKSPTVSLERLPREPTCSTTTFRGPDLPSPSLEASCQQPAKRVGKPSIPLELVMHVWNTLVAHSNTSDEGTAVFDRASSSDASLVDRMVEALRYQASVTSTNGSVQLPAVWNGSLRRRWISAALVEAGGWGSDGMNFS